ncbi:MAG: bifunctional DNA-binding transcriptional regulator/O6-methylguanine-DNA methyltransferase Ada [Cyanobacteria bacterium HKST-UBA02]|nr:bifunctional DNA-binding transcriptional regulator/O6-methylguanine-DNA methyltransferase Ada [Cyanobacteria bacterium HKST-UBA02]
MKVNTNIVMSMSTEEDTRRWQAVVARDRGADEEFVYAVLTTGVYCRPSCGSRQARRENVRFFDQASQAEEAGFRPCKRCRPQSSVESDAERIASVCRFIDQSQTDDPPALDELASRAGLSRYHFHRLFKATTGVTPSAYVRARRRIRIRENLRTAASVTEAIYESGYGASSRFYEKSSSLLGMTPGEYREGAAGLDIRFAVGQTSLGAILVAMTGRGVCAIIMDDDPDKLMSDLAELFPGARLIGGDTSFDGYVAMIVGLVEDPLAGAPSDLPLDIAGTAFQEKVWQALLAIPPGTTTTYGDIARSIGAPRAVRAVASACAANKLAVAIPCHRVVRADGSLSGYRWGVERKKELLAREKRS